jgi:hypothetical protein
MTIISFYLKTKYNKIEILSVLTFDCCMMYAEQIPWEIGPSYKWSVPVSVTGMSHNVTDDVRSSSPTFFGPGPGRLNFFGPGPGRLNFFGPGPGWLNLPVPELFILSKIYLFFQNVFQIWSWASVRRYRMLLFDYLFEN